MTFKEHAMYRYALAFALPLILMLMHAVPAAAATGTVTGTAYFPNNSWTYCDASGSPPAQMDCTGALFPATEANGSYQPVRDSWVVVQRMVDPEGLVWESIGGGPTNASGVYTIQWTTNASTVNWRMLWMMRHRDGAFWVIDTTGATFTAPAYPSGALMNGGTLTASAWFTDMNQPANIYSQAWRAWNFPLKQSTLLWANMWGVNLKWPVGNGSSANTQQTLKTVNIEQDGWAGSIQTAHELGHVASYVANPYKPTAMYNWPAFCRNSSGSCLTTSWGLSTPEWGAASFEEGQADFIAMGAHYWFDATGPRSCLTSQANCRTGNATLNVEVNPASCNPRWPASVTRFLWDTYDNIQDASYADTLSRSFASAIDVLGNYPNSTTGNGKDAPWNSAKSDIDDEEGRGAVDYVTNSTTSVSAQRTGNCSP